MDIEKWDSPVARQHGIRAVPTLWLYRDGRRVADNTAATMAALAQR